MKPIPMQPNMPQPTNCFGNPVTPKQWYICPHCGKQSPCDSDREKLAQWMIQLGFATGHGDTMEQLLDALGTEIMDRLEVEREDEREACAKLAAQTVCDTHLPTGVKIYGSRVAEAIRARSEP